MKTMIIPPHNQTVPIPESVASFQENGFGRFHNLIDDDELHYVRSYYDKIFADPEQHRGFKNLGGKDTNGNHLMPQIGNPWHNPADFQNLQYFKKLESLAKSLIGDDAEYRNDHMIFKPAGTPRTTPWHQDQAYHSPEFRYKNINFWLPLDGATVEGGCMWYVPRTHMGTVHPHVNNFEEGGATAVSAENQDYWMANAVPVPCPKGSVTAHQSYCMHYAGANNSTQDRKAWIVVFACPPDTLKKPIIMPWWNERREILQHL